MIDYAKLAEALGVELGDRFYADGWNYVDGDRSFRITETGIELRRNGRWVNVAYEDRNDIYKPNDYLALLGSIVTGKKGMYVGWSLVLENGDEYWSYAGNDWSITKYIWTGSMEDQARRNMYATFPKEYIAVRNRPALYKRITGKEWIES